MKENSALNLSSHPNFEGIFNAAMDRIDIEIKRARENAVSHDQYMAIRKEQTELVNAIGADQNRNDEISKKIDELEKGIEPATVTVETLPEFRYLLYQTVGAGGGLSEVVEDSLNHENAHSLVAAIHGFQGTYKVVFMQETEKGTPYGASVSIQIPNDIPSDERRKIIKEILEAPESVGSSLSNQDRQHLQYIEDNKNQ